MCQLSLACSSAMHSSCCEWGSSLGASPGRDPSRSFFMIVVSGGGVEVLPWASFSGCSPIPDCIVETFHSFDIPINVGKGQSRVHHFQQPDHPYGSFSHWWGGKGKPGHGDYLLSPWQGKDGATGSTLHFNPVGLSWTNCSGGEDIHQFTLPPIGVFQLPLSGCKYSTSRHVNHSIPTGLAAPMQTAPFLSTQVILLHEKNDEELNVYPLLWEALWESSKEDHHLSDPVLLLVPPSSFPPHQEDHSQTKEGPSLSPALTWLQSITCTKA